SLNGVTSSSPIRPYCRSTGRIQISSRRSGFTASNSGRRSREQSKHEHGLPNSSHFVSRHRKGGNFGGTESNEACRSGAGLVTGVVFRVSLRRATVFHLADG